MGQVLSPNKKVTHDECEVDAKMGKKEGREEKMGA